MKDYLVIGNVKRKGKLLPRGEAAPFDPREGDDLVARGYLAPVTAKDDGKGQAKP